MSKRKAAAEFSPGLLALLATRSASRAAGRVPALSRQGRKLVVHLLKEFPEVDPLNVQGQLGRMDVREIEHLLEQPQEALRSLLNATEILALLVGQGAVVATQE